MIIRFLYKIKFRSTTTASHLERENLDNKISNGNVLVMK